MEKEGANVQVKKYRLTVHFEITREQYTWGAACLAQKPETKIRHKFFTPIGRLRAFMRDRLECCGEVNLPQVHNNWRKEFSADHIAAAEMFVHQMLNPEKKEVLWPR